MIDHTDSFFQVKIEPAPLIPLEAPGGGCASARQPTAQCSPFGVCNETGTQRFLLFLALYL